MERKKVSSSKIRSIGYDERAQTLEVEFNNGSVMQYSRVSADLHRRMMNVGSVASFFEDHIQDTFSEKRIR